MKEKRNEIILPGPIYWMVKHGLKIALVLIALSILFTTAIIVMICKQ